MGHSKLTQMKFTQIEFNLRSSAAWATGTTTFVLGKGVTGSSPLRTLYMEQVKTIVERKIVCIVFLDSDQLFLANKKKQLTFLSNNFYTPSHILI